MYILGVFGNFTRGGQDPSAALLKDGKIIAAAEEERFMRIKHPVAKMPIESINFCLKRANITIEEVDVVAFGASTWNDIKEKLKKWSIEYKDGYSNTGIVAWVRGTKVNSDKSI